jgi:hypothetical protein
VNVTIDAATYLRCPLKTAEEQDLLSFTRENHTELEYLRPLVPCFQRYAGLITPYPVTFPIPGRYNLSADQLAYQAKACAHIRDADETYVTGPDAQKYLIDT